MKKNLKDLLEHHYKAFDRSSISPDPLQFLHLFKDRENIEVTGFLASVFAYGNVKQIISSMDKIISVSSGDPYTYIKRGRFDKEKLFRHRFYTEEDILLLLRLIHYIFKKFGSIEQLFMQYYSSDDENIKNALSRFSKVLLSAAETLNRGKSLSSGVKFMFPSPESGSACKRMNLFLRWMIRKDELDFGIWKNAGPDKLIIPVDTHIARICRGLNLTSRKNISWNMAEEITANLKKFDPHDPVKYDFAICHIGMRKMNIGTSII